MTQERTLILVKPDAMQRALAGEVISRYERRGLKIVGMKLMRIDRETAERHYGEHREKSFFPGLVTYITSSPVIAAVLEGPNAIDAVRATNGATNPIEATPGSLRADFGLEKGRNLVHASDSAESAVREVALFFDEKELVAWPRDADAWIFE
ncbi:nucleoside-diphosphate kinase [bacterium]|jgi:nucleoside-diphosphate kinase|nr:nucleoside-diphosphate kinase [bacterium]